MTSMGSAAVRDECSYQTSNEARSHDAGIVTWLDAKPGRAFGVLILVYFAVVFVQSSLKLMWLDEFITLHLARLNGLHALWNALAMGADPNPPVTYILVHWSRQIFGDHEWAYRLPAAVGCAIGLTSLFAFLKPRVCGAWAMFGCLVWMAMAAFDYSFESRSYGIFYGLAMLAFFCWTAAIDASKRGRMRWLAWTGMVLA